MSVPEIPTLPYTTVQHDFPSVISDVRESVIASEDFWISCYREGSTSVHGKVNVSHDSGLVARESGSSTSFMASCPALEIPPTRVRIPRRTIQLNSAITAFDVTPDGTRVAACTSTGLLSVRFKHRPAPPFPFPSRDAHNGESNQQNYCPHHRRPCCAPVLTDGKAFDWLLESTDVF
ncbi:hypothetical protein EXIGLDRAFT_696669 [Exidia glandulosa HHB12029]|uniref:Uncharacterized protein n=1 Tax=Exidia glandulosa HHB12029 TaxID=1314781 RepID=A0A165F5S0_EXIGL|nr:hypothetical protein EXIGLDRAFT_696669 [Exidia glandulosa HHB12029]